MKVLSEFTESICQKNNFQSYYLSIFLMTELTCSTAPQSHLSCITVLQYLHLICLGLFTSARENWMFLFPALLFVIHVAPKLHTVKRKNRHFSAKPTSLCNLDGNEQLDSG